VVEVQVVQAKGAQLPQPEADLGGEAGHGVVAGAGQPLAAAGQLTPPAGEEAGQGGRRWRHPDGEVAAVAGPVDLVDRRGDQPAGQLVQLAAVAQLQEPVEEVDRAGLATAGVVGPMVLVVAQEPVGVAGLDLPGPHPGRGQERLEGGELAADGAVGHPVGQAGQDELGQQVLLVVGGVGRVGQGLRGPQVAHDPEHDGLPRVQQSQRGGTLSDRHAGIATPHQESGRRPRACRTGRLSRDKAKAGTSNAPTNSQPLQHWAEDLDHRVAEHQAGRGARLIEVITQAGIGLRLARTWPGVTRARERQLKRQGGASRYCPICQEDRKARGIPRRPHPNQRAGHAQPGGSRPAGRWLSAVPTRGTQPDRVQAFLELNPNFARPARASTAKQWGRGPQP
jgi:hypothetical protein